MPKKYTQLNPPFQGKPAQKTQGNIPYEGEIFKAGPTLPLRIYKEGKMYTLDPFQVLPTKSGVTAQGQPTTFLNTPGAQNYGEQMGQYYGTAGQKLGIDISGLYDYNPADITAGLGRFSEDQAIKVGLEEFLKLSGRQQTPAPLQEGAAYKDPNSPAIYYHTQGQLKHIPNEEEFKKLYGGLPEEGTNYQILPGSLENYQTGEAFKYPKQQVKTAGWQDVTTGQPTQPGGQPPAGAEYITDPAELSGLREDQIWRDPSSDRIYKLKQATLTSPTGEKEVVSVGSKEANDFLKAGYTLGDKRISDEIITSQELAKQDDIKIDDEIVTDNGMLADQTVAGIEVDVKSTEDAIKKNLELWQAPESDLSKRVDKLIGETETEAGELVGRGALQLAEEEKRKIEEQQQVISDKTTELNKKLAEVKALTASYQLANQQEEGRPQTLFRLQGAQAQNYKMFLAQKNVLVSEAGYIQAELLGLQNKLDQAQQAANRAVDLEFLDREASYKAKLNQLNILLPQLEKEEKEYAQAVTMTLNQEANATAEQKAQKQQLLNYNLEMMASYPSAGIKLTDTPEAVNEKVAALPQETATPETKTVGGNLYQYNPQTGQWDLAVKTEEDMSDMYTTDYKNWTLAGQPGTFMEWMEQKKQDDLLGGLTKDQRTELNRIQGSIKTDPDIKGFIEIRDSYNRVNAAAEEPSAAGDLALIFNYMKMLDPGSVVRESEFANAAATGSFGERFKAAGKRLLEGERLSDNMRNDFVDRANRLYNAKLGNYEDAVNFYENQLNRFGIPSDAALRDYTGKEDENDPMGLFQNISGSPNDPLGLGFNQVGGDTDIATGVLNKVVVKKDGTKGGQCGRFVNQITGLGVGDTYQSKISKMDKNIKTPAPGMVFVMPYKDTGHTGIILSVNNDGTATVKDSNWSLDNKIKTHKIAISNMTGFAKV